MRKRTSNDRSINNNSKSSTFVTGHRSESTRSVRRRAPPDSENRRKLSGVNDTSPVPAVTTVPVQHLNNFPKLLADNCALISSHAPAADFDNLLSSSDKLAYRDKMGSYNIALHNIASYCKPIKPANHSTPCVISQSGQKIDNNKQVSISCFRSSAASDKNTSDNLKGFVPTVQRPTTISDKTDFANETQQNEHSQKGHLFADNNNRNSNNINYSYTQSEYSRGGHRLVPESGPEKFGLHENCDPDKSLASAAFKLKVIEGKVSYCENSRQKDRPCIVGSDQSYPSCPIMNNCYNYSSNCAQLQQTPAITCNPCAIASAMDSVHHLNANYCSSNDHVTQNYVTNSKNCVTKASSCQNNSFVALIHHDYGQQQYNASNCGVLQNITNNFSNNNQFMMNQVNDSRNNILSSYRCNDQPIVLEKTQEIGCSNSTKNLGYNSEDSLSDKENNFVNIAKMDSSYFSLSADELSNQSESTGSGCTSATRTSRVSSTEGFNSANSNSCDVESEVIEEELQIDYEDCGEHGACASDGSCDCDLEDGCQGLMTYNDENKSYDASGDSESDISSDNDDQENTISSSCHFGGPESACNETYVDEDVSFKTSNNSGNVQPSSNGGGPLCDVTSMYNSSDVNVYQRMLRNKVNGQQTKTKELTPVTASMDATMIPGGVHIMKAKTNVKPLASCTQTMTPDTIAATRKIMADTPLTPTTSKMSNLTMKSVELFCPIPNLNWGDNWACWEEMLANDDIQHRLAKDALTKHPRLSEDHRTIVLEWLSEVTLLYHMRKDTFYVAVNFFDRFLAATNNLGSDKLQLLGITALFTASKIEEIYPPPSKEFASVTNGLCEIDDLIETEICLVNYLGWKLNPVTPLQWILLYLQLYLYSANDDDCLAAILTLASGDRHSTNNLIVNPNFEPMFYHKATCILDLCTLSYEANQYTPRLLAAAVILSLDFTFMRMFSFLNKLQLQKCFYWLTPFVTVASKTFDQESQFKTRYRNNIMLHYHTATMESFKEALALANHSSNRALFVNNMQPSPFDTTPDEQMKIDESEDKDNEMFSLNPADQINMVLLSPPYDS